MPPASQWAWRIPWLDVIEYLHRDHAGFLRDVAADHQHHAELADGMGEAEDRGGDETGRASGRTTLKKQVDGARAQVAAASSGFSPIASKAFCNGCTTKGSE